MNQRRGQSAVEFALMAPIIFLMVFGLIYSGIMFMEYLHYANAVRTAAREIAVKPVVSINDDDVNTARLKVITAKKKWLEEIYDKEVPGKLYRPKVDITPTADTINSDTDVVVTVSFEMNDATFNSLPGVLRWIEFPPRTINTLQYRMKLEKPVSDS